MEHRLVIELATVEEVDREWRDHLSCGGAFVPGAAIEPNQPCVLVIAAPGGARLELAARTVFRSDAGVGVQLDGFDAALRQRVQAWMASLRRDELDPPTTRVAPAMPVVRFSMGGAPAAPPPAAPCADDALDGPTVREAIASLDLDAPVPASPAAAAAAAAADAAADADPAADTDPAADADAAADADPDADADPEDDDPELTRDPVARNVFERLRNLSVAAQLKIAREGELQERVALERLYGKTVWEAILRCSRVTHPEVARIARMGALPRPLIELIVGNTAWLRSGEIRRALLANKRLGPDQILRVLRFLPKHELRLVPVQSAYPLAVRDAARKILKAELGV